MTHRGLHPGLFLLSLFALTAGQGTAAEFALRDGDTVVFLGDSITAARTYGKIIENYTLLRYPMRRVHFLNAGWGGDTALGGLKRLDRDVIARGATVLTVAYGVNDIGWGTRADESHRKLYLDSIRGIVERCKLHGVRVYICSAAITAEDPDRAEKGFLQAMCDEGMAIARTLGEHSIDVQRGMRQIQRRIIRSNAQAKPQDRQTLHAADGIHLNDMGQLAMALVILKGLGAPADVSSAVLDTRGPGLVEASGCHVFNLSGTGSHLVFDRLDDGLPVNFGLFGALPFRHVPIPDELNRYMLTVKNLEKGNYDLSVDGRLLGKFAADRLAAGVNLSSATADGWEPGGPWEAQAWSLIDLTDARDKLALSRRSLDHYLPDHPHRDTIHHRQLEINRQIEELQSTLVRPRPFHFVLKTSP